MIDCFWIARDSDVSQTNTCFKREVPYDLLNKH